MRGQWRCRTCHGKYNKLAHHIKTKKHIAARTKMYGEGRYVPQGKGPALWQRK